MWQHVRCGYWYCTTICRNSAETPKNFRRNSAEQLRRNSAAPRRRSRRRSLYCKKFLHPSDFFGSLVRTGISAPQKICEDRIQTGPTDSECPSNSDFDILRSSIYRMGKMGGGGPVTGPPRTDHYLFRPDIRTSCNSRIRSPFDESQLPNSFH